MNEGTDLRRADLFGTRVVGGPYRTDRFGPLMLDFTLDRLRPGVDREEFWAWVSLFGVGWDAWFRAWQGNQRNFLDVLAWGHDHDFGGGRAVKGTMDDRHVTNLERVVQPGGLDPARHVAGMRVLVVGAYCGGEVLLMHALGAAQVDAMEEVPEYARACGKLADAFGIRQVSYGCSLYELPEAWEQGVPQDNGDPGAEVTRVAVLRDGRKLVYPARGSYDLVYCPGVVYHLTDQVAALRILRDLLAPGGTLAFETGVSGDPNAAAYQGPGKPGWNWWVCGEATYVAMMRDVGLFGGHKVEQAGGRAWFMGERSEADPLSENGCAGFSIPGLLGRRRGYR
jgi:SAM-dependent methyltransferase